MIINKLDNAEVDICSGHKYALRDNPKGSNIVKYGSPIGHATEDIRKGDHVHTHHVKTNLSGTLEYAYRYKDYGIATNHKLAETKKNWLDFDASPLLEGTAMVRLTDDLPTYVLRVASGEETNNEKHDYREISIFKDGVTL